MRRMTSGGGGADDWNARNMSYTNLAAMAESFEVGARLVPAVGRSGGGGTSGADLDKIYLQAQDLINTGCAPNICSPRPWLLSISHARRRRPAARDAHGMRALSCAG